MRSPPILDNKDTDTPSVFEPAALLREARRQKGLPVDNVPAICILDPDGDIVRHLKNSGRATHSEAWPCYHTDLYSFRLGNEVVGIVGCAVGAPFAVLVAEQLFVCGCRLLISLTSAGQIVPAGSPPYFVVIDRALRDEGTSYHYAAADLFAKADPRLVAMAVEAVRNAGLQAFVGPSWTTDAPFRETAAAVAAARAQGILAVEMEAAALYTFARKRNAAVLCLAHVTNTMGLADRDFEKGEADGTADALMILEAIAKPCVHWPRYSSPKTRVFTAGRSDVPQHSKAGRHSLPPSQRVRHWPCCSARFVRKIVGTYGRPEELPA